MPEQERYEIELLFEDLLRDNVPREERRARFMRTAISMLIRTGAWREETADQQRMNLFLDCGVLWEAYMQRFDRRHDGRSSPMQENCESNLSFEKLLAELGVDTKVTPSAYRKYQKEISPEVDEIVGELSVEKVTDKYIQYLARRSSGSGGHPEAVQEEHSPEVDESENNLSSEEIPEKNVRRSEGPLSSSGTRQEEEERMGQEIINAQIPKESLEQRFVKLLETKLKIKSLSAIPQALTEEQELLPNVERWRQNG